MPRAKNPGRGLLDSWGRRNNRKYPDRACPECGSTFQPRRSDSAYCSVPCARKKNGGQNKKPEYWWTNSKGYVEGRVWVGSRQRTVKYHRWVMERHLGRALRSDEVVHHIDGDKANNDLDNLQLMGFGEHSRMHNKGREHSSGYTLSLTDEQRAARSRRAKRRRLWEHGHKALAKARGKT